MLQRDMRKPLELSQSYLNPTPPHQMRTSQVCEEHCTKIAAITNVVERRQQAMQWGYILNQSETAVLDHAFSLIPGLGNRIFDRIGLEGMHDVHLGPYPETVGRVLFYYTHDTDNPNFMPFSTLESAFAAHPWDDVARGDIPEPFKPFHGRQKKEGKQVFGASYGGWPVPGIKSGE